MDRAGSPGLREPALGIALAVSVLLGSSLVGVGQAAVGTSTTAVPHIYPQSQAQHTIQVSSPQANVRYQLRAPNLQPTDDVELRTNGGSDTVQGNTA